MSIQNAMSWGYFDIERTKWQQEMLRFLKKINKNLKIYTLFHSAMVFLLIFSLNCENFPSNLLSEVKEPGFRISNSVKLIGQTKELNCSIYVPLGDLQCSVRSCLENDNDCSKNI
jgi:hypothetical protein